MKKTMTLLLLAAMLVQLAACGGDVPAADDTTAAGDVGETTAPAEEYDYPALDLGGAEFTVLTVQPTWAMNTEIDLESQTGEALDDAIYKRNRWLEEKWNFKLGVVEAEMYKVAPTLRTAVAAGDDVYDIAFPEGQLMNAVISEGAVMNLFDVDTVHLTEPWWNQITYRDAVLGKDEYIYFAQSNLSLIAFDLTWCLFFNEGMMADLKLDMPYQLVKDGKWTMDRLIEYCKKAANLNGDDSFAVKADGKATYGLTQYYNGTLATIVGAGIKFAEKDDKGMPKFNLESERFYNTIEKICSLTGAEGEFLNTVSGSIGNAESSLGIFAADRALFAGGEVKGAGELRNMESTFGLLPYPKMDETQEEYRSWTNYLSAVATIPVTAKDVSASGAILDALSYLSYRDVLPVYYDITVSQKGLRNEESIEMLAIIRDSLCFDSSLAYGCMTKLPEAIPDLLMVGDSAVASTIASQKETVQASIDKMMGELMG